MRLGFSLLLAHLLMMGISTVQATTWTVPSDVATIGEALEMAAEGDTLQLSCGTFFEHDLVLKSGMVLKGSGSDPSCVVIDAQGQGRVVECVDLAQPIRIENLTIQGGRVVDGWFTALGGGIRALNANLTLIDCVIQGNSARIGAGLGASESTITVMNCSFLTNTATHEEWAAGGAIWARDCSGEISSCSVVENTAFTLDWQNRGDAGGFFFNNCRIAVSQTGFERNATGLGAGAFYSVQGDSSIFDHCFFIENSADHGGAVYFEFGAAAQLEDCLFQGNTATAGGAGFSLNEAFPTFRRCTFVENVATQWGGGAFDSWDSEITLEDCVFQTNTAETYGGAVNLNESVAQVLGSLFVANSAGADGGAIRGHYSEINLQSSTLYQNSALLGGGLFCGTDTQADIEQCIISHSLAGAGIDAEPDGGLSLSCTNLFANVGGDWVGAVSGWDGLAGNISADPLYCDPDQGEFGLSNLSPGAPAQSDGCGLIGAYPVACVVAPVEDSPEQFPAVPAISDLTNHPNPFNPRTVVSFSLDQPGLTRVEIFDVSGKLIRLLAHGPLETGPHQVVWTGQDTQGRSMPSGAYFFRVTQGDAAGVGRMLLLR